MARPPLLQTRSRRVLFGFRKSNDGSDFCLASANNPLDGFDTRAKLLHDPRTELFIYGGLSGESFRHSENPRSGSDLVETPSRRVLAAGKGVAGNTFITFFNCLGPASTARFQARDEFPIIYGQPAECCDGHPLFSAVMLNAIKKGINVMCKIMCHAISIVGLYPHCQRVTYRFPRLPSMGSVPP